MAPRRLVPATHSFFAPGQAHQLRNDGAEDLVVYVVADNPIGESTYFPDTDKYVVQSPQRRVLAARDTTYFDDGD